MAFGDTGIIDDFNRGNENPITDWTNILNGGEIVSNQGISSIYGVMFSSATLASAIAPTVFGILADNYGFEASFLFLGAISLICFFF